MNLNSRNSDFKKNYCVYGLIDPRNNTYFYIGKGKGKRYADHLNKTNQKRDLNFIKVKKIKEIEKSGYSVVIDIVFSNLDENTAFELESILIYRLGREIFNEGILTNLVPGGRWKKGDSILYQNSFSDDFDISKLDLFAQEKLNSFPKTSRHEYFDIQNIYIYDKDGEFNRKESLNEFFKDGVRIVSLEIYKNLRENKFPIFSNYIFSKKFEKKLYISKNIPFTRYDIIDENFNKEIDRLYKKEITFELECKIDGIVRMKINRNKKK